jgi:hypothetical protein
MYCSVRFRPGADVPAEMETSAKFRRVGSQNRAHCLS